MKKGTNTGATNRTARLQFTEEELKSSSVKNAASKAEKAADQLDSKKAKLPKKKTVRIVQSADAKTGTIKTKLSFEESTRKAPSKLSHTVKTTAANTVSGSFHHQLQQSSDEDIGADTLDRSTMATEAGIRTAQAARTSARMRAYHNASKFEKAADQANLKALYKSAREQNPELYSNPLSRARQKKAIQREYAAAKRAAASASGTIRASHVTEKAAASAGKTGARLKVFFTQHKKGLIILGIVSVIAGILMGLVSSCSMMAEGIAATTATSTYPSEDSDMLSAEALYCSLESDLQSQIDNYESTHSYDEYIYNLDDIEHDPYVLISMLTAMKGDAWTLTEMEPAIHSIFGQQYTLEETVTEETRTRTEMQETTHVVTDPETGETVEEIVEEEVEVEYPYYICTVTLINNNLSHLPVTNLTEEQLELYSMYIATLGNRPDLFPDSDYVGRYDDYLHYDIPVEALSDEKFANMIQEAEKYLGYPYVWGGSSPSTSFDCSGFVCWVINHSGNGWNVGRVDAESLRQMLSIIPASEAKPGDIIFFQGTYDTYGASHVGIYVGNNMMIHCGDPISYADISSSYWQQHFYCFGRLS